MNGPSLLDPIPIIHDQRQSLQAAGFHDFALLACPETPIPNSI